MSPESGLSSENITSNRPDISTHKDEHNPPRDQPLTANDKIQIILAEYNTLREELIATGNKVHSIALFASGLFVFTITQTQSYLFWISFSVSVILTIVFSVTNVNDFIRLARRVRELETEINKRAGEKLLTWETCYGLFREREQRSQQMPKFKFVEYLRKTHQINSENDVTIRAPKWFSVVKIWSLAAIVTVTFFVYSQFGDRLSLASLAQHESALRSYQQAHPTLVYAMAFLVYVVITGLSLPGAAVLTLLYGWYFGFIVGLILVSFSSTAGATTAFLLSRFLFRDAIQQRFGARLLSFNEALKREGPFFLFSLRLIPAVPFFIINAVMGLTPIRLSTFWWVSQTGMLPVTAVYVYAGSSVPSLQSLSEKGIGAVFSPVQLTQILVSLVVLGLFPLAVRGVMKVFSRS